MNDPAHRPTSTTAVVSLITGLLGWSLLPFVGSVVAIITGHIARSEIRRNPEALQGDGLAVAGLILGYATFGIALLALIAVVMLGGLAALAALAGYWN
ncbi:MAG: DUF4190 domain-containing protein [Pseudomonadota bacterium]|nr:DUF4190 domain-containing protein [Pseudomonadota bacterium]